MRGVRAAIQLKGFPVAYKNVTERTHTCMHAYCMHTVDFSKLSLNRQIYACKFSKIYGMYTTRTLKL